MIPVPFDYAAAATLEEAVKRLQAQPGSRVLAGGQSLIPALTRRRVATPLLVDLRRVPGLARIERREGGGLRLGALATLAAIQEQPGVREQYPALAEAIAQTGDPQVRHRSTIGGCLAESDPGGDLPAAVLALGTTLQLIGPAGARSLPIDQFFVGPGRTSLQPAEIITAIDLPAPGASSAYEKFRNLASDYAICGAAALVEIETGGVVGRCRVALTGATDHARRLPKVEAALAGAAPTPAAIAAAAGQVQEEGLSFLADLAASADYRAHLAQVLVQRAVGRAAAAAPRAQ